MLFEISALRLHFQQNALVSLQCYRPRFGLPMYATALTAAVAAVTDCAAVLCAKQERLDDDPQCRSVEFQAVMSQKCNL